eukprot:scaffold300928_cov37-Prasinocladus_malaysianus.AAC.1
MLATHLDIQSFSKTLKRAGRSYSEPINCTSLFYWPTTMFNGQGTISDFMERYPHFTFRLQRSKTLSPLTARLCWMFSAHINHYPTING